MLKYPHVCQQTNVTRQQAPPTPTTKEREIARPPRKKTPKTLLPHLRSRPHPPPKREKLRDPREKNHRKHSTHISGTAHTHHQRERNCATSERKTTENTPPTSQEPPTPTTKEREIARPLPKTATKNLTFRPGSVIIPPCLSEDKRQHASRHRKNKPLKT